MDSWKKTKENCRELAQPALDVRLTGCRCKRTKTTGPFKVNSTKVNPDTGGAQAQISLL